MQGTLHGQYLQQHPTLSDFGGILRDSLRAEALSPGFHLALEKIVFQLVALYWGSL